MYVYIIHISAINGYIFFFQYKSEPGIATTPGICKQTSTYFVFIPMLSIRDLIPSWKSSLHTLFRHYMIHQNIIVILASFLLPLSNPYIVKHLKLISHF